jgi:hypothetical protein
MTRKRNCLAIGLGAGLLFLGVTANPAHTQPARAEPGRTWLIHSTPQGNCPGVDWDVTRVGNALHGVIGWDSMQKLATLDGSMGANGVFQLNVKQVVGGDKTAVIDGKVRRDGWLVVTIQGTGTGCDGQQVNIPIWRAMGS